MSRLLARLIELWFRLPDAFFLRLAGGTATVVAGRTLEPRLQWLTRVSGRRIMLHELTPPRARAAGAAFPLLAGAPAPGVGIERRELPGPAGPIPVRFYRPRDLGAPSPLLVYLHQGGFVVGTLDWCESFCTRLAAQARCRVVSVDYRLAPEHRWPAPYEDALAAWRCVRENAQALGADPARLALGGDSAGGTLTAHISHALRECGEPQPAVQLLIYPWVAGPEQMASYTTFEDAWPLNRALMDWFLFHVVTRREELADPRFSPLRAPDHSGLAPALVYTAGYDPLCDEGEAYAAALEKAGVPVVFRRYDALTHCFTAFGAVPAARHAQDAIAAELRRALHGSAQRT